jgi:hypothetical protein
VSSDDVQAGERNALCGIVYTAYEFADRAHQRRVWVDGEGPWCSSYRDAVSDLFDSYRIEYFASERALDYGFSAEMLRRMRAFTKALDEFHTSVTPEMRDAEIILAPGWNGVVSSAGGFLDSAVDWLENNCADFTMLPWTWAGRSFGT